MHTKIIYLIIFINCITKYVNAQNNIKLSYQHARFLISNEEYKDALIVCDSVLNALSNDVKNEYYNKTLLNKQIIYINVTNYKKAIEIGNQAFINYFEAGDILGQSKIATNMVQAYYLAGDKSNAIKYGKIAIGLINQLPGKDGLANLYNSIAIISEESGDTISALRNYYLGLAIANKDKDSLNNNFTIRSNLIDIYLKQQRLDSVKSLITFNENLIKKNNKYFSIDDQYSIDKSKFELLYARNDFKSALNVLYNYYDYINSNEDLYYKRYYYKNIYLTYKKLKNNDSLIVYLEKYAGVLNETDISSNRLEINKLSFDLDLRKEQALNEQKINYEKKIKTYILLLSIVILVIVIIFLIIVFKNLQKQKLLTKRVEKQAKELKEKQKEILDSIHYAKRIQMAIMPNKKFLNKHIKSK